jgi:hypothetical protein
MTVTDFKPKMYGLTAIDFKWDDLLQLAQDLYGKNEQEVKALLKMVGHTKWNPLRWYDYLAHFKVYWDNPQEKTYEKRLQNLEWLEERLTIEVRAEGWVYTGEPKALAAHWELENIRRRKRMKQCRERYGRYRFQ